MPEILTKYPDTVLTVLKSGGVKCGEGVKQEILTKCPSDHFCALPKGEICVYGIHEKNKMTQLTSNDLGFDMVWLMVSCLIGIFIGMLLKRR